MTKQYPSNDDSGLSPKHVLVVVLFGSLAGTPDLTAGAAAAASVSMIVSAAAIAITTIAIITKRFGNPSSKLELPTSSNLENAVRACLVSPTRDFKAPVDDFVQVEFSGRVRTRGSVRFEDWVLRQDTSNTTTGERRIGDFELAKDPRSSNSDDLLRFNGKARLMTQLTLIAQNLTSMIHSRSERFRSDVELRASTYIWQGNRINPHRSSAAFGEHIRSSATRHLIAQRRNHSDETNALKFDSGLAIHTRHLESKRQTIREDWHRGTSHSFERAILQNVATRESLFREPPISTTVELRRRCSEEEICPRSPEALALFVEA